MSGWHRDCLTCGASLDGKRGDAIFCSAKCRNASRTSGVKAPQLEPGTKRCTSCGVVKPTEAFDRRTDVVGPKAHCRDCTRLQQRAWRERRREHLREQARERYQRNVDVIKARSAEYKRLNREKARAHSAVEYALETGRLVRPDVCDRCQRAGRIHAHHHDYTRKLDVEWLCPACHGLEHSTYAKETAA